MVENEGTDAENSPGDRRGWLARHTVSAIATLTTLVVIVAGAVVAFGVPGSGFHGVFGGDGSSSGGSSSAPSGGSGVSGGPENADVPIAASFAYGTKEAWRVTPTDLGITAKELGEGNLKDVTFRVKATSDSVWLIEALLGEDDLSVFGVDPATGMKKWGPLSADVRECASEALRDEFYCDIAGKMHAIDVATGKSSKVAALASDGDIAGADVVGDYLLVFDHDKNDNILVRALSSSGNLLWTQKNDGYGDPYAGGNAIARGVILVNTVSDPTAVDATTGETLFQGDCPLLFSGDNHIWANCGGSVIYSGNDESGLAYSFTDSTGKQWRVSWPSSDDDATTATDFSAHGLPLSVRDSPGQSIVDFWEQGSGSPQWATPLSDTGPFYEAHDASHILIADMVGDVWALSPQDGNLLWYAMLPSAQSTADDMVDDLVPVTIAIADGKVALATYWNGQTRQTVTDAFSPGDGSLYWSKRGSVYPSDMVGGSLVNYGVSKGVPWMARVDPVLPQPRTASLPTDLRSCADGRTPVSWSVWSGGHTLVCSSSGKAAYYVTFTDGSGTFSSVSGSRDSTGAYVADTDGGNIRVDLDGSLVTITRNGQSSRYVAGQSWSAGAGEVDFTQAPLGVASCPSAASPIALATWNDGWFLVCGTSASLPTYLAYMDGSDRGESSSVSVAEGGYCGDTAAGRTCVYRVPPVVVIGSAQHSVPDSYFIGSGAGRLG